MASTAKASEQVKQVQSGLDLSTHTFFSAIADAVKQKMEANTGLKLTLQGKKTAGKGKISAVLVGQIVATDPDAAKDMEERIRLTMQDLKNPTNLLSALK